MTHFSYKLIVEKLGNSLEKCIGFFKLFYEAIFLNFGTDKENRKTRGFFTEVEKRNSF